MQQHPFLCQHGLLIVFFTFISVCINRLYPPFLDPILLIIAWMVPPNHRLVSHIFTRPFLPSLLPVIRNLTFNFSIIQQICSRRLFEHKCKRMKIQMKFESLNRVEHSVVKGDIALINEQYLLLQQCFQKWPSAEVSESVCLP